jgi:Tfp pilus assembly protein PilN
MKEIDLLPEWYKSSKRQQIGYRTQYVALAGVFVVIMVWNFIMTHSISKATAEIAQAESKQAQTQSVSREFNKIKSEVAQLQKKTNILEKVDSKIDVASVLAEISFLIDEKIVLSAVEFKAERFAEQQASKAGSGSMVVPVSTKFGSKGTLSFGDIGFKIVISGVAADAGDVAELICRLEDSPYFFRVIPSFSRNREIKIATGPAGQIHNVSEFEISCELANYRQEEIGSTGEAEKSEVEK